MRIIYGTCEVKHGSEDINQIICFLWGWQDKMIDSSVVVLIWFPLLCIAPQHLHIHRLVAYCSLCRLTLCIILRSSRPFKVALVWAAVVELKMTSVDVRVFSRLWPFLGKSCRRWLENSAKQDTMLLTGSGRRWMICCFLASKVGTDQRQTT